MSVWQVVLHNLWGFDLVIVLVALGNALCFAATRRQANELYRRLHRLIFVPSRREHPELLAREISAVDEEEIIALRHRSESLYAVYVNVTAIFPLLGILGTVLSLLPMVADLSNMQMNFFAALTSTISMHEIGTAFFTEEFLGGRHADRVNGIREVEDKNFK